MRELFEIHLPKRFIVGTVGDLDDRDFFIQAKDDARLVTISLEAGQCDVLAQGLDRILDELIKMGINVPIADPGDLDLEPLNKPIEVEFDAQSMGLAWNEMTELITLEIHGPGESQDIPDVDENPLDGPPCLRVRLSLDQARAFVARTNRILAFGAKPCQFCQMPIEPRGHICPRANGYRR
jgi:uncharacterized repeat protein (TIGR03847 family)